MDSNATNEQSFSIIQHDDGIYSHPNELSYGPLSIVDQALEIIEVYRKVKDLQSPPKSMKGIPDKELLKQIKDRAGRVISASSQLYTATTKEEHLAPRQSFYQHAEPVYSNFENTLKYHGQHCWKVALLNAYRILDLQGDKRVPFPYDWIAIEITSHDTRYPTLLASAAYFMGLYYAKALALEKAPVAVKGKQMTKPNQGHYSPLGKVIYKACEELELKLGKLPQRGISKILINHLEHQNLASCKQGLWKIFTNEGKQEVDSKQLGKYISRYRKRST